MFRSIRWRLVASYTLMTILAVTLVGVLALFLIERYLVRQERDFLTMGATTVAQQIEPILRAPIPQPALQDLVRTTALLSDVQVRILNADEQLLADSGQPSQLDAVTWSLALAEGAPLPGAITEVPDRSGVFVQFSTERKGRWSAMMGHKAPQTDVEIGQAVPPLVVFRRGSYFGSDPTLQASWQVLPAAKEFFWSQPTHAIVATEPITTQDTSRLAQEGTARHWFGVGTLFTPAMPFPQRVIQTVENGGEIVGYVELRSDLDYGVTALALIRRAFLLAGVGVSLLALFVALWMSHSLTAPLHELIAATNQMRGGVLSSRAAVRTRDEIGLLAAQFNTMAAQLESSFAELAAERDALRRFVADASHELRTPITALKTFGELLLGPAGDAAPTRTEFLLESQKQLARLEWITSALLKLSRLDAGLADLKNEKIDLRELVTTTFKPFVTQAEGRGILLCVATTSEPAPTFGNPAYLETALANLLNNALKFTPTGGIVQVSTAVHGGWAELVVQDNGLGIAAADRPYIFDRFYRGLHTLAHDQNGNQTSHSDAALRGATEEGSGLGLAIVQSIIKAHGGQVAVQSEVGVGSRFVVKLPLAV